MNKMHVHILYANTYMFGTFVLKIAASSVIAEAILEDKIANI